MRGKIDLSGHKLAGLYHPPARRSGRKRMEKCPDETYRQLWRLVDGAVRDAFANHPEYLTTRGKDAAARSITKRVTGTLHGYAVQTARGRSGKVGAIQPGTAADRTASASTAGSPWTWLVSGVTSWARSTIMRACGGAVGFRHRPKFSRGAP